MSIPNPTFRLTLHFADDVEGEDRTVRRTGQYKDIEEANAALLDWARNHPRPVFGMEVREGVPSARRRASNW